MCNAISQHSTVCNSFATVFSSSCNPFLCDLFPTLLLLNLQLLCCYDAMMRIGLIGPYNIVQFNFLVHQRRSNSILIKHCTVQQHPQPFTKLPKIKVRNFLVNRNSENETPNNWPCHPVHQKAQEQAHCERYRTG